MKRVRVEPIDVIELPRLLEAAHRAARGKRDRDDVQAFYTDLECSLDTVGEALERGRLPHGTYRRFRICDPKPRIIHAAPFADRVAHHALMAPLEQPLDNWQPATSFACRRGLGTHKAIAHAQRLCRRHRWYLKTDIAGYFEHINHETLVRLLHRRFRRRWLFELIDAVLASYWIAPGRGLPIGALTSQHFANAYLVPADRWLIDHPLVRGHCRYMDDTVFWTESSASARALATAYREWLGDTLHLELKPAVIQPVRHGLSLCGTRIRPERLRPGRRRQRRFRQRLDYWEAAYADGWIDSPTLQRRLDALVAMLAPGESINWRRELLHRRAALVETGGQCEEAL